MCWGGESRYTPLPPSEDPTSSPVADMGKEVGGTSFLVHLPSLLHSLGLWAPSTVLGAFINQAGPLSRVLCVGMEGSDRDSSACQGLKP